MFDSIVIGIDGHEGGPDAVALVRTLAAPHAQLTLVHVWSELDGLRAVATGARHPAAEAHDLLEVARRTPGLECHLAAPRASSPGSGLHRLAEQVGADLIVVGSSGRRAAGRVLLDDDTRAALHGAPCGVAVAPHQAAERGAPVRRVGVGYEPTPAGEEALRLARDLARGQGAELHAIRVVSSLPDRWFGEPLMDVELIDEQSSERRARGATSRRSAA